MLIIGVDPGLNGGVAMGVGVFPMPVIGETKKQICPIMLAYFVRKHEDLAGEKGGVVYIEKVGARPGQGVTSMYSFGYGCGTVYGVFATLGYIVRYVTPQRWKKLILGVAYAHDKEGAIAFCGDKYPNTELVMPRCRTPHDGIADAVCIREYGVLTENIT